MINEKLRKLQLLIQQRADFAWQCRMRTSKYNPNPTSFGRQLEISLNAHSREISLILDDIAQEQIKEEKQIPEPPDFSKYIRYSSSNLSHKEVFIGDKWVLVPNEACVDFRTTTLGENRAFSVNISNESNYATFTSTESLKSYQKNQYAFQGD